MVENLFDAFSFLGGEATPFLNISLRHQKYRKWRVRKSFVQNTLVKPTYVSYKKMV